MKKIVLFILLLLTLPIKINALEYQVVLSGGNLLHAKDENLNSVYTNTTLSIDITNLENIASFNMYIEYDSNLVGINNCNFFNYIAEGCHITEDKKIYYNYKYTDGYDKYINNYKFYHVNFMPKDTTPETGTTTVTVTFENAKDQDGNPIYIKSSSKTYTFAKPGFSFSLKDNTDTKENIPESPNEDNNQKEEQNNEQNQNNISPKSNIDTTIKSNNNYLKELKIENYEIEFDKNKFNYQISLKEDINKLEIKVTPEDQKATYNIKGADNLKENDYQILIEVISESGEVNTYKIKCNKIEKEKNTEREVINLNKKDTKNKVKNIISKKNIIISSTSILILFIIVGIIIHRKNKKMDKMFKGL